MCRNRTIGEQAEEGLPAVILVGTDERGAVRHFVRTQNMSPNNVRHRNSDDEEWQSWGCGSKNLSMSACMIGYCRRKVGISGSSQKMAIATGLTH
jgi:hypothetical protein